MAYGSLIHSPGDELAALIADREPYRTSFPVEYGRQSPKWGGGPTLTIDPRGGPVDGERLLLIPGAELGTAMDVLARREGIPSADGIVQVGGGEVTQLTCALPVNLPDDQIDPAELARRAVDSAAAGPQNGVAYLRGADSVGIATPRTERYIQEVLQLTGAGDLVEAERLLAFRDFGSSKE